MQGSDSTGSAVSADTDGGVAYRVPPDIVALSQRFPMRSFKDATGRIWEFRDSLREGPVLVLLPGAAGGGDVAYRLVQDLCGEVRTISITYPGGMSPQDLSNGLVQLLNHLAVGSVALWGSSYGAWWSQAFASRHPERVSALWLGNTLVDGEDVVSMPLFSKMWLEETPADAVQQEWITATRSRPPSELRDLQLYFISQTISAENLRSRLLEVACSTALEPATGIPRTVVSDCLDDPIIGVSTRKQVLARYPQAQHVQLKQGGHYPHLTNFEALRPRIRCWLELE